jgi:hypothetical protein
MFGITYLQQISDANLNVGAAYRARHLGRGSENDEPGGGAVGGSNGFHPTRDDHARARHVVHGGWSAGNPEYQYSAVYDWTPGEHVQFSGTESCDADGFPFATGSNSGNHAADGEQSDSVTAGGDRGQTILSTTTLQRGHEAGGPNYGRRHQ